MNGRFENSLKQLREDVEREGKNDRDNHISNANCKRVQPMEGELLSDEVRRKTI